MRFIRYGPFLFVCAGILIGMGISASIYRAGQGNPVPGRLDNGIYVEPASAAAVSNRFDAIQNLPAAEEVNDRSQSMIVSAVRRASPSIVSIDVRSQRNNDEIPPFLREYLPDGEMPELKEGEGSGIIINGTKGLVLTNYHVVRGATRIDVRLKDRRTYVGKVIGTDPFSDIALVKVPANNLPTATLGDPRRLPVGSWVIAIGNPLGFQHTVTVGVVSAMDRTLNAPNGLPLENLVQTDAAINPGNSGGALCDLSGNVIGMNTAIIPSAQGLGFAVDIDSVKRVVTDLIRDGKVRRAWLGISFTDMEKETARLYGVKYAPGALVTSVRAGEPADRAGLRRRDIISAVNRKQIREADELRREIRRSQPGERIDLIVVRGGKALSITVRLGTMPDNPVQVNRKPEWHP